MPWNRTLHHLNLTSAHGNIRNTARTIIQQVTTMEFLTLLFVWEKILRAVYAISKQLQSKSINLAVLVGLLRETVDFVSGIRNDFDTFCEAAETLARKWGIQTQFKETRKRTKKCFLGEIADDRRLETPSEQFRVNVSLPVVDTCLGQFSSRFESLQNVVGVFSFLFPNVLLKLPDAELEIQVTKFVKIYDNDISADFMRQILAFKACACAFIMKANNPNEILNI